MKGTFLAFEGADGVGKSTVLRGAIPLIQKELGCPHYAFFHWKPLPKLFSIDSIPGDNPHTPRGKGPRNVLLSLAFLTYHLCGFWFGYFARIRPFLKQGYLVIADRYVYDFLLDPVRFRLKLPQWILQLSIKLVPQPERIICLYGTPSIIEKRKKELSQQEIEIYQNKLQAMPLENKVFICADHMPDKVIAEVVTACKSLKKDI